MVVLPFIVQGQMMAAGTVLPAAKSCVQCQQTKPAVDFHIEARSPDGLTNKCKDCRRIKQVRHMQQLCSELCPRES